MDPETIDSDHGWPFTGSPEKQAAGLLDSHQFGVRPESKAVPDRFGDDDAACFIDPDLHTI